MERKYDIILFGATGFTGQLIAQYLATRVQRENIRWAIAGRDDKKLEEIKNLFIENQPDIIIANVKSDDSLANLTSQCTILMNAVGPFNWYGKKVVEACIQNKTHYLDITGEPSFVADVYNTLNQKAINHQVCVVNCCGFDSIPADFCTWLTAKKLPVDEPKMLKGFIRTNASFSGGTLTTAVQAIHLEVQHKSVKTKIPKHPAAPKANLKIHYEKELNFWAIPMPVVDPHIVKRSIYNLPEDYGKAATYVQFFVRSSFLKVVKTVFPIVIAMIFIRFSIFRNYLFDKFKPGTGPNKEKRDKSKFEFICLGTTKSCQAKTVMAGNDPGYNETAKMFSESAFCLLNKIRFRNYKSGVCTPVEAFGIDLVDRLRHEGIQIEQFILSGFLNIFFLPNRNESEIVIKTG